MVPATERVVKNPKVKAEVEKMGYSGGHNGPAELNNRMADEYETANSIAMKIGLKKEVRWCSF